MRKAGAVLVATLFLAGCQIGPNTRPAVRAAEAWLALVDQGAYEESWREASGHFKGAVTEANWKGALEGIRKPLGAVVSRQVKSAKYMTVLPGAPDGEYVMIMFATAFEKKQESVETVTPQREPDGVWRVSGYYVK